MERWVEQFGALGQRERLKIFRLLVRAGPNGHCVDEIRRRLKLPGSTLSHHLETLRHSGLVSARRDGRFIYYAVNWRETAALIHFLTVDCCADLHTSLARKEPAAGCDAMACGGPQPTSRRKLRRHDIASARM